MIHSYSSIYNLGHKAVADILQSPVCVEEKVDGSQFSFGVFIDADGERVLKCRSKGAELNILAPEKMFKRAVDAVKDVESILCPGATYRAEYLAKPKHNTLCYGRIPINNLMIFDVDCGDQDYLPQKVKAAEADRLGFEVVPLIFDGVLADLDSFREFLGRDSALGGAKIEGVVVKNYQLFGLDKKVLMAKFVSEAFKESHGKEWKIGNPAKSDLLHLLIEAYKTPARWAKAVQHLKELGQLEDSPRDIEKLMKEVPLDIEKECADEIKDKLWDWAWPKIARGCRAGLAEWYKEELLKKQFEEPVL